MISWLGRVIETKKGIRRFIVLTCYPAWLYCSVRLLLRGGIGEWESLVYGGFSSIVGVIIGFYFYVRGKEAVRGG